MIFVILILGFFGGALGTLGGVLALVIYQANGKLNDARGLAIIPCGTALGTIIGGQSGWQLIVLFS